MRKKLPDTKSFYCFTFIHFREYAFPFVAPQLPKSMQGETSAAEQTSQATVAESHELKELHDMIYGNMSRESSVPLATYVKFEVCRENHDKAEQARCERAERDQIRTEKARAQYEATQERRAKVRGRNSNATKELMERNLEHSQMNVVSYTCLRTEVRTRARLADQWVSGCQRLSVGVSGCQRGIL
jgi:hypothetical protein